MGRVPLLDSGEGMSRGYMIPRVKAGERGQGIKSIQEERQQGIKSIQEERQLKRDSRKRGFLMGVVSLTLCDTDRFSRAQIQSHAGKTTDGSCLAASGAGSSRHKCRYSSCSIVVTLEP